MSGDTPDFNIDNYGIDELLSIFGITSPLKKEAIMKIAAGFIEKYQKLKQTAYVEFFSKAMNKLVSNYNLVEGILGKVDGILDDIEENGEELMEEANNLYEKGLDFIEDAKEHVDEFLNPEVEQAGPNVLKNRYYNGQTGPERVGQHVMPNRGNYISVPTEGVSSHAPQLQQRLMLPNAFAQIPFAQGYRNPTLQNVYISWINVDSQYREIKARTVNTAQCDESEQETFNNNNSNFYLQNDNSTDFLFTLQQPMTNVMAMTVGSIEVPLAGYYAFSNSYGNTTFEGNDSNAVDLAKIGSNIVVDYEHYLPRIDRLFLSSQGEFIVVKGEPSEKPKKGAKVDNAIEIAVFTEEWDAPRSGLEDSGRPEAPAALVDKMLEHATHVLGFPGKDTKWTRIVLEKAQSMGIPTFEIPTP